MSTDQVRRCSYGVLDEVCKRGQVPVEVRIEIQI